MYQIKRSFLEPYPTKRPKRGNPKYPFHDCGMGDSFFVPEDDASIQSVRTCASKYGSRHRLFKFTCQSVTDYDGMGPGTLVTRKWIAI
jgi:hypothetical protein